MHCLRGESYEVQGMHSTRWHTVRVKHHTRDASYKGRIVYTVQRSHLTRWASYKGRIVKGTHRTRAASNKGSIIKEAHHLGTHFQWVQGWGSGYQLRNMGCFISYKKITKHAKLIVLLQSKILRNSKFASRNNETCFVSCVSK
jgi:hypothetical protein